MITEYQKLLSEFVGVPTVSSDASSFAHFQRAAAWLVELLTSYGFHAEIKKGYGNPIVSASYMVSKGEKTCLIYGHYDVQPAVTEEGWESNPFVLTEKAGRLFGRGAMDDKGQLLLHIIAIGTLIQENKLGYNIKFLFEGEEELGSPHIEKYIKDNAQELSCDFVLLSDGEMILGKPTIELGNRGILNATLTLQTASHELHSGIYGGAAPNAIYELSKFLASLQDTENRITIPGFYDTVDPVDMSVVTPFDVDEYTKNTGARALLTVDGQDFHTATGLYPSLTITSIAGGYEGSGHKTAIPPTATAKLSFRLVKSQIPQEIFAHLKVYAAQMIPSYVSYTLSCDEYAFPNKTDKQNPYSKKAEKVLTDLFTQPLVQKYVGGSEPALTFFQQYLQVPIVSIPFGNEDGHMHGPNENFLLKNIEKGLSFSKLFYQRY